MIYVYIYHGSVDIDLPEVNIHAKGNDEEARYYPPMPINHPDFELIPLPEDVEQALQAQTEETTQENI